MIEFRAVVTRPTNANGLGLSSDKAQSKINVYEQTFQWLHDTQDIYIAWKSIVSSLGIIGKQVHDARIVALCHVHQVDAILTYNLQHFQRFANAQPPLLILDPAQQ